MFADGEAFGSLPKSPKTGSGTLLAGTDANFGSLVSLTGISSSVPEKFCW